MIVQGRRRSRDVSLLGPKGAMGLVSGGKGIGTGSWDGRYIGAGRELWVGFGGLAAVEA
jgi:hypothetical protein